MRIFLKRKKNQVFIFDAILSFIFIVLMIGTIYSLKISKEESLNLYSYGNGIMDFFFNTELNSLNEDIVIYMFKNNIIKDIHISIAQEIALLYYQGDYSFVQNFTKDIVNESVPKSININITIGNSTTDFVLYSKVNTLSINEAKYIYVLNRKIFGMFNATDFYGPYSFKIKIWQ